MTPLASLETVGNLDAPNGPQHTIEELMPADSDLQGMMVSGRVRIGVRVIGRFNG